MGKRVIIAGGGTGGHIFPAIAIANALRTQDPTIEILFVGAKGKMEMEKIPQAGYKVIGLDIAGFNRSSLIKNIGLPLKLVKSFLQVSKIFSAFRPDAVVGVGGYSSFPVLRYAIQKHVPVFIHESNSFAGKSNMMLGRKATKVFVATDGMEQFFPVAKLMITGNPVRSTITSSAVTRDDAIRSLGLDPAKKTVLSIGGSLGAKSINEALAAQLDVFAQQDLQLIWQTGKPFAGAAKTAAAGKTNIWVSDFISGMEFAFAAADVVISRAGAMTIAELCVVGKPVIFVPYPFAAEDHQTVNAQNLVKKQAGLMIPDTEVKEKLLPALLNLCKDEALQQSMKSNISAMGIRNAAETIAAEIITTIK